jgi:lipopolysaccharide heptosyltransferase I
MGRERVELSSVRPDRVCIIKPSALGDIVNAFPTLSALRGLWPNAHIAWVVNRGLRDLVEGHPQIDEVIAFDRSNARFTPRGIMFIGQFFRSLRHRRFDVTIDLQGLLRSGLMTAAAGAPVRVGIGYAREGASRFYTHIVPTPDPEPHAVERLLEVARAFGAKVHVPRCAVAMSDDDRRWAREKLAGLPAPRLVMNVGARWVTKRWPPEKFAAIALRAVTQLGAGIVAVGAPDDQPTVDILKAELGSIPVLDLCGRTTLPQLAAIAAESELFLSNDSGPLHLATAVGTRVVGIYTCTSPELNGPYGPNALAVRTNVACAASYITRCRTLDCMTELSVERVWAAVAAQWNQARGTTPTAA